MILRLTALLVLGLSLSACATPDRFEWGGYENQLYRYHKNPENRDDYRRALENAIARGQETNRVAPGLNAELGYLAYESGDTATAQRYFEAEMRLFPESRAFLQRLTSGEPLETPINESSDDMSEETDAVAEVPTS